LPRRRCCVKRGAPRRFRMAGDFRFLHDTQQSKSAESAARHLIA
jgi:hypothetical protein